MNVLSYIHLWHIYLRTLSIYINNSTCVLLPKSPLIVPLGDIFFPIAQSYLVRIIWLLVLETKIDILLYPTCSLVRQFEWYWYLIFAITTHWKEKERIIFVILPILLETGIKNLVKKVGAVGNSMKLLRFHCFLLQLFIIL